MVIGAGMAAGIGVAGITAGMEVAGIMAAGIMVAVTTGVVTTGVVTTTDPGAGGVHGRSISAPMPQPR
jgi:hypothetical protein